jgi:hypothetical protein
MRDRATPIPTAAATGRRRVARNVVTMAICDVGPVRRIVAICPKRSARKAA